MFYCTKYRCPGPTVVIPWVGRQKPGCSGNMSEETQRRIRRRGTCTFSSYTAPPNQNPVHDDTQVRAACAVGTIINCRILFTVRQTAICAPAYTPVPTTPACVYVRVSARPLFAHGAPTTVHGHTSHRSSPVRQPLRAGGNAYAHSRIFCIISTRIATNLLYACLFVRASVRARVCVRMRLCCRNLYTQPLVNITLRMPKRPRGEAVRVGRARNG